jgi:hypothetical protein
MALIVNCDTCPIIGTLKGIGYKQYAPTFTTKSDGTVDITYKIVCRKEHRIKAGSIVLGEGTDNISIEEAKFVKGRTLPYSDR